MVEDLDTTPTDRQTKIFNLRPRNPSCNLSLKQCDSILTLINNLNIPQSVAQSEGGYQNFHIPIKIPDSIIHSLSPYFEMEEYPSIEKDKIALLLELFSDSLSQAELSKQSEIYPSVHPIIGEKRLFLFSYCDFHSSSNCDQLVIRKQANGKFWCIGKIYIHNHYGTDIESFQGPSGETVFSLRECLTRGSGIWHFDRHYFVIRKNKIVPVFSRLDESNLSGWSNIDFHIRSYEVSHNPLKIAYAFELALPNDSCTWGGCPNIHKDSVLINLHWSTASKTYKLASNDIPKMRKIRALRLDQENELIIPQAFHREFKAVLSDEHATLLKKYICYLSKNSL